MPKTFVLKAGESVEINGTVKVLKCGLRSDSGAPAVPTVTLVVNDDAPSEPASQAVEEEETVQPTVEPESPEEPAEETAE